MAEDVSGSVSGNWLRSNSPYRIVGNVVIETGNALFIEAGVSVIFAGPYAIEVQRNAVLKVRGDSLVGTTLDVIDTVKFYSASNHNDSLGRGVRFNEASNLSEIRYAKFQRLRAQGIWPNNNGGAIYVNGCNPTLQYLEFYLCRADVYGGAIHFIFSNATLEHALIDSCRAVDGGGAINLLFSNVVLRHVTAVRNSLQGTSGVGTSILVGENSNLTLSNSVLYRNAAGDSGIAKIGSGSSYSASYSYWRYISRGSGNVTTELQPSHWQAGTWKPSHSSPLIDAGDPSMPVGPEPRPNGNRRNVGYYGGTVLATQSFPVAQITPAPERSVIFGNVKINRQVSQSKRFSNIGRAPLAPLFIKNIISSDPAVRFQVGETLVTRIDSLAPLYPDSSYELKVIWTPTTIDSLRSFITWEWNNLDTIYRRDTIIVTGKGINPRISISQTSLNFGSHRIYSRDTLSINISNVGLTNLFISRLGYGIPFSAGFGANLVDTITIPPGSPPVQMKVAFSPDTIGYFSSRISIFNNDSIVQVNLTAYSEGPYVKVNQLYNFGYVPRDTAKLCSIKVYNSGNEPLRIDSIRFTNSVFRSAMTAPITIGIADTVLARPDSGIIPIIFQPTAIQVYNAQAIIYSNDGRYDTINVRGQGVLFGTYLAGNITERITVDRSPYVVTGTAVIPRGTEIRIEAGSRVLFEPNATLKVEGVLLAEGNPNNRITFDCLDSSRISTPYLEFYETTAQNVLSFCNFYGPVRTVGGTSTQRTPIIKVFRSILAIKHSNFFGLNAVEGGAIHSRLSSIELTRNTFTQANSTKGGFVYLIDSRVVSTRNEYRNARADNGGVYYGQNQAVIISRNDLYEENASKWGGTYYLVDNCQAIVDNSVFVNNQADSSGSLMYISLSPVRFSSNIVTGVLGPNDFAGPGADFTQPLINYSLIERVNSSYTPLAIWGTPINYHVLPDNSPAIDAGDPNPAKNDYWFPPAKGTARNDVGLTGGPYYGIGDLNLLGISLFSNQGIGGLPEIVVFSSSLTNPVTVDTLLYVPDQGTSQVLPLTPIPNANSVFRSRVPQLGPALLTAKGHTATERISVTRRIGVITSGTMSLGPWEVSLGNDQGWVIAQIESEWNDGTFGPLLNLQTNREVEITFCGEVPGGEEFIFQRYENGTWITASNSWKGNGRIIGRVDQSGLYKIVTTQSTSTLAPLPNTIVLEKAYPNPFNASTTLKLFVPSQGQYKVTIYDLCGRQVATLMDEQLQRGYHQLYWNGLTSKGVPVSSGLYYVKATAETGGSDLQKIVLIK
ncbi:MAG: choice-of-anchor D domain-containing protein [bacterium]|nr:choice-of-anchor D domain-containing protein [bacterium]